MRRGIELAGGAFVGGIVLALAAPASAGVVGDYNGDGFADLAIGVEGEDLASPGGINAGAAHVIYGTAEGLDPVGPPAAQFWHEEVEGVLGNANLDEAFGDGAAAGDFDGDGRTDLAVSASEDAVSGEEYAGTVRVLYAKAGGLRAAGNQRFSEDTTGVPGQASEQDHLGANLAAGDFNGDGRDDVAAYIRCQRVRNRECAGAVLILYGSNDGLTAKGSRVFHEDTKGIAGAPEAYDEFGEALAAGNLDGRGPDDLAVGVPSDDVGNVGETGTVRILQGSRGGITADGDQRITADQGSLAGSAEENDNFGSAVAAGQIEGSGALELVVGTPGDDDFLGGSVTVVRSGPQGPDVDQTITFGQGTIGVEGTALAGDLFGCAVAIGNFDGEFKGDLAVGARGDDDAGQDGAGAVNVLYSGSDGLGVDDDLLIHQALPSVDGTAEQQDQMGGELAAANFDGANGKDLAVTVPFDQAGSVENAGSAEVFYSAGPTGIDAATAALFHQATAGIESEPTESEYFGESLAAGW